MPSRRRRRQVSRLFPATSLSLSSTTTLRLVPAIISGGFILRTFNHGGRHRHRQGALSRAPQQPRGQVEGRQALRRPGFPGRWLNRHIGRQGERAWHLPEACGLSGKLAHIDTLQTAS